MSNDEQKDIKEVTNTEANPEKLKKKKAAKKTVKTADKFNESDYYDIKKRETEDGFVEESVLKKEYRNHLGKCRVKTAKFFDTSIAGVEKAYETLCNRKVDGFYVTELIDRHGFHDGRLKSRGMLLKEYNMGSNQRVVDIAESKIKDMIESGDVAKAYNNYRDGIKKEMNRDLDELTIYGE